MARGFESKQVESQQADRERGKAELGPEIADPVAAAARRTLQLGLARAEAELAKASNPTHRAMLQEAVADLLTKLEQSS